MQSLNTHKKQIKKDVRITKLKNAIQEPTLISHETTRVREEGEDTFDITN